MADSLWFTTRSALFQPGDAAWEEVIRYEQPLRRLIARRYASALDSSAQDDLVQDILIEIKQSLSGSFDPSRGRFRALLQTVVRRRVIDGLRRARPAQLPDDPTLAAPEDEALDALDLEAALVAAVGACRDAFSGGKQKDLDVLHALSDRLVHGKSAAEIARATGVGRDVINRRLTRARDLIFRELLAPELGLASDDAGLEPYLVAFKRMLRKPGSAQEELALPRGPPPLRGRRDRGWARALTRREPDPGGLIRVHLRSYLALGGRVMPKAKPRKRKRLTKREPKGSRRERRPMSEVLLEFMEPVVEEDVAFPRLERIVRFAAKVWNGAMFGAAGIELLLGNLPALARRAPNEPPWGRSAGRRRYPARDGPARSAPVGDELRLELAS